MNSLTRLLIGSALVFTLPSLLFCAAVCPTTIENDPPATADGCGVLVAVGTNLSVTVSATGTAAYDGASSSTIGIVNSGTVPLTSLWLSGTGDLTYFGQDGIRTYLSANGVPIPNPVPDPHGYENYLGPLTTVTAMNELNDSLLLAFGTGLAPGASTYLSLPLDPASAATTLGRTGAVVANPIAVAAPECSSVGFLGLGLPLLVLAKWRLASSSR